jgi:receptor protein-tyrosine kinase
VSLQEFERLLRTRWITLTATFLITVLAAVAVTLLTTPLYKASTKIFVSTTLGASAADLYEGNRLSQERVLSYTQLLMGRTLAQRTANKLDLKISPTELQEKIKATTKPDTVLIDVTVLDTSPARARYIADTLSDEFVVMVRELETPRPGAEPDARVIVQQRAVIPTKQTLPNPVLNIAVGMLVGGLLAIGLAILRDRLDNTVKDRETLEHIAGVSVVGDIPFAKVLTVERPISFDNDKSGVAEAFRRLRTNLQFLSVDDPARLILITSAVPREGKTTTAVNIALALAEAENEVLLVDGDMRRPSVHKYLRLVGSGGFSTVISGAAELSDVLQRTEYPHLTVLAAGATPPNPSELLGSQASKNLLDELRERFDYVIIDTAPLLAVTDTAVLATRADGALIMTRFGETKREQLANAKRTLEDVGAPLLGAVFTMTPTTKRAHGYYDYYDDERGKPRDSNKPTNGRSEPVNIKKVPQHRYSLKTSLENSPSPAARAWRSFITK